MIKRTFFALLLLQFALLNSISATNSQEYQKGWEAFANNNRTEARNYFNQAIANPETKFDALLSLCLLDYDEFKFDAAFTDFQQFYAGNTNPYPYFYALNSMPFLYGSRKVIPKNKLDFLEKIVSDPNMNGTLKAMSYEQLGSHYLGINNPKKAKEWYAKMGAVSHWQVLGTFDNTSGSGFSKDWGAVAKTSTDDVFKNKVDADVKWYIPSCNKQNNWFYFDYYFVLNNAIMYAQSFVNSPVDQEVYMRTGTSGSLKIWVNDALVSSVSEERNCDLDIYCTKIKLNKGNNRILIQIGQSEIDDANFLLRLTDANANPLTNITDAAVYADYTKSTEQNSCELLPFFAEEFLSKKISEFPSNPLNYVLLAETYLRNDKAYEATKVLKELQKQTPKSTLVSYLLAEAYTRAKNQTDYDKEMESIKLQDPNSFIGLQEAYNEAVKSEKYSDAADICAKAKQLYGENETTEQWDVYLASYQKRVQDLIALAEKLYKKYPDNADFMNIKYQIEKNVSTNPKTATSIVENYCKTYSNSDGLGLLANIYFEQGKSDKGIAVLKQRLENMPYATGYLDNLSSTLYRMQRYNEALAVTDQIITLSPFLPSVYNTRGYIYKSLKENEKAKENFRKSIYYGPTMYDSRTQLRLLENKKEVSELFPKNDLSEIIAKAPTAKDYPQDNSIFLLDDHQLMVYPEGAKEYRYEKAVKILNQSGIEDWKEYSIGYNGNSQKLIVDKAEVIKANGTKVKAETNNDNRVVFTNLDVNDVLHLDYRIQDLSTGKLANHFFDNLTFQRRIPTGIIRYSILAPKNKPFNYLVVNGSVEPKISDVEDMKLYQWEVKDQPAVKDEPSMSALADIVPMLYYSSMPDWKYVSNWYKDLTYSKFNSDYVLKETVAEILKGHENASQLEKAKLFYYYILENITYSEVSFLQSNFIPQKASRTITTRLGDCKDVSTLFVALCREVGINANLVLISTRNYGNKTMPLPAVDFNHCIAQLNLNDKKFYLELTDKMLPFGAALNLDLNSEILPIPSSDEAFGEKLITFQMPFRPKNMTARTNNIVLTNNDMKIERQSVYYAAIASDRRNIFRNIGSEQQQKTIVEGLASDFIVPIKVTDLNFINLDNLCDSVILNYKVDIKNALQEVAGMKILKLPWSNNITSLQLVTAETRKYPIRLWSEFDEDINTEQMTITLPQGKNMVEIPQNVKLECENASYQLTFESKISGKIIVRRTLQRKTEEVSPQEYNAFKDFLNRVSEADNKQYAIK